MHNALQEDLAEADMEAFLARVPEGIAAGPPHNFHYEGTNGPAIQGFNNEDIENDLIGEDENEEEQCAEADRPGAAILTDPEPGNVSNNI